MENDRVVKNRNLFKKIGDIKGTFHARMGMIKNRNNKDLIDADKIKKRWQEYIEEYKMQKYKKVLIIQITVMVLLFT